MLVMHGDGGKSPTGGDCLVTLALTTMITCVVEKERNRKEENGTKEINSTLLAASFLMIRFDSVRKLAKSEGLI